MDIFDFDAEAELFPDRGKSSRRHAVGYRRFDRAADAIRFAIEQLPEESLVGAYLEIREQRFDAQEIRQLYERPDYPLERRPRTGRASPLRVGQVVDISSVPVGKNSGRRARS